jgi:hypothetical protein
MKYYEDPFFKYRVKQNANLRNKNQSLRGSLTCIFHIFAPLILITNTVIINHIMKQKILPKIMCLLVFFCSTISTSLWAQVEEEAIESSAEGLKFARDSLYLAEVENKQFKPKVLHAEPLYIDLIRDLGARKGEREWNVGFGLTDKKTFDRYTSFVEYEFAPVDRLGLEAEITFEFYFPIETNEPTPGSRLKSLKLAAQHSFWVSDRYKSTLAWGYLNETEFIAFKEYRNKAFMEANIFNPFLVGAKRWGNNFHTLLLGGPEMEWDLTENTIHTHWQVNTNVHYMIPGTRNFIGLEVNKDISASEFRWTLRPQMRLSITDDLLIGIVAGVPVNRERERMSSFMRLIYEPPHKPKKII